jgi:hypothetical protein
MSTGYRDNKNRNKQAKILTLKMASVKKHNSNQYKVIGKIWKQQLFKERKKKRRNKQTNKKQTTEAVPMIKHDSTAPHCY